MSREDLIATYLSLSNIKGISNISINNIYRTLGSLKNIFKIDPKYLQEAGLSQPQIESIQKRSFDEKYVSRELELIKRYKIDILLLEDEHYPELLKNIPDPPALLYIYGDKSVLKKPSIAIVGSRESSIKGKSFAKKLSRDLAEIGFNIVSGFASGIDISAHLGAMEKGFTTAVFGNGLLKIYPSYHKKYIPEFYKKGCIVSEFPLEELPGPHNFPKRNRIISGLSLGVVVVEAAEKSGSFITAKLAIEYQRDLFAVPAWPEDQNRGTNKLIKEGAKLVENYFDIVEEYSNLFTISKDIDKNNYNTIINTNEKFTDIINILKQKPATIDEICMLSGKTASEVLQILTEMELNDLIIITGDGRYTLN
ncbi:MAG: DNA-processing protein DprA [Calditerrivibrio sp.]|nr:DNA-processing protein DprA [Calditerrivibrio sp.]